MTNNYAPFLHNVKVTLGRNLSLGGISTDLFEECLRGHQFLFYYPAIFCDHCTEAKFSFKPIPQVSYPLTEFCPRGFSARIYRRTVCDGRAVCDSRTGRTSRVFEFRGHDSQKARSFHQNPIGIAPFKRRQCVQLYPIRHIAIECLAIIIPVVDDSQTIKTLQCDIGRLGFARPDDLVPALTQLQVRHFLHCARLPEDRHTSSNKNSGNESDNHSQFHDLPPSETSRQHHLSLYGLSPFEGKTVHRVQILSEKR